MPPARTVGPREIKLENHVQVLASKLEADFGEHGSHGLEVVNLYIHIYYV